MAPSEQDHDARPVLVAGVLLRGHEIFRTPIVQTWAAVFVSIVLQALPFLTLGVALSAVIAVYVSRDVLTKVLPSRPVLAVPAAAVAGVVLPGCECGSVPVAVAGALLRKGRTDWIRMPEHLHDHGFLSRARHDFLHAGGFPPTSCTWTTRSPRCARPGPT